MSESKHAKPFALAAGALFATAAASGAMAADNPFGADELSEGYNSQQFQVAEGQCGEGTCGEGTCGEDGDKDSEGQCGEGTCGEGTCG